jgi:hypothetical protein
MRIIYSIIASLNIVATLKMTWVKIAITVTEVAAISIKFVKKFLNYYFLQLLLTAITTCLAIILMQITVLTFKIIKQTIIEDLSANSFQKKF